MITVSLDSLCTRMGNNIKSLIYKVRIQGTDEALSVAYVQKHTLPSSHPAILLGVLLMHINDLLHFVIASHEDPRAIMDMLRHDCQHPLHVAIDGLSSS